MDLRNIIITTNYLEFVNKIDELVFELLYAQDTGYVNLYSKKAIIEAQDFLLKFDETVEKIKEESKIDNVSKIIFEKRNMLIKEIKKHYKEQTFVWCDEVYDDLIENCITSISMDRKNKNNIDKNFQKAINAISWISNIKNLTQEEENILFENFNHELDKVVKENKNYLSAKTKEKTNEKDYLKLFNLIIENEEEFLKIDFSNYLQKLNEKDLKYFKQLQISLKTFQNNKIKDEIMLIKSAFELLNLKNDKDKYEFIKNVENDFNCFKVENKKLTQEDKVSLIQKRMKIFKDKLSSNNGLSYFKNLLKVNNG